MVRRLIYISVITVLLAVLRAAGQAPVVPQEVPSARYALYQDAHWEIDEYGDSIPVFRLRNLTVFPPLKFKNDKEEEFYWRTVRNVKIALPYAKMIRETLIETYEYIETFDSQKEREAYLKRMEKSLFEQYKPVLKRLSKSQAQLLVKLIQRETDQSSYEIVKAFLGSFRAFFWQGFGRFFGVNLKGKYDPARNRQDHIINRVCTLVEEGVL